MILRDILHRKGGPVERPYTLGDGSASPIYTISERAWARMRAHRSRHQALGNGFSYRLLGPDDVAPTLAAHYHKDPMSLLIWQGPRLRPRSLTPREAARLMGYPDSYQLAASKRQAFHQLGNSVIPAMIGLVFDAIGERGQDSLL